MNRKYKFLQTAATIFKVIGWIVLILGIISSIVLVITMGSTTVGGFGVLYAIIGIVYSVISWVGLLAVAEIFVLLIDLEENTRETAELLRAGSKQGSVG